ncbi:MAG TPA: histidine phosphatase family protein [Pseudolysinimonas sp.]|nr:histidine phosphatase family protein [Pseudolysinimonas sp.]
MYAFIRHGQTDWNRDDLLQGSSDIPLNAVGRQQAFEVAELLAGTPWMRVVSSPLARAAETARIIADELGIPYGPSYEGLTERDYGSLEGSSAQATAISHPDREYPGAESLASVAARGQAALDRIAADYPVDSPLANPGAGLAADGSIAAGSTTDIVEGAGEGGGVVIVSHGTLIRETLAALARRPVESIHNGSMSTVRRVHGTWIVETVNGEPVTRLTGERLAHERLSDPGTEGTTSTSRE